MRLAGLLRLTALGIALLCWLDPPSSRMPPPPIHVDAAIVRSSRDSRPVRNDGTMTVVDAARQLAVSLADELGRAGTVRVHEVSTGDPLPCDATQPCVIITEGAAVAVPADRKGPVGIVQVGEALSPNVDVTHLAVLPAHLAGQASARVSLAGAGVRGKVSRVRLFEGPAVVGEAVHEWSADGDVTLDVPWWPLSGGARTIEARAVTEGVEERTEVDNALAAGVDVIAERWPIALVERRPSWAATFIRRALEDDRRFAVATGTDLAPRVRVATPAAAELDSDELDRVRVMVVGAPDALTADDVARLDRFVRQRGGAVVLVPDRPLSGPVTALLHHRWRERLDDEATQAGPLRATEWLLASDVTPLDRVWAESRHGAAVIATPTGAGVVLVSGALDSWRHRSTDGAYERFWQATVAGLAMAVGPPVDLEIVSSGPAAGDEVTARVTARTTRRMDAWRVTATRTCDGGESAVIRLWPADAAGAFTGRVPIGTRTGCEVEVVVPGLGDARAVITASGPGGRSPRWTQADLAMLTTRTGGPLIRDENMRPLVQAWLDARSVDRRSETRYPMRAWWWVVPFAASLAGEWWLRRRAGLR